MGSGAGTAVSFTAVTLAAVSNTATVAGLNLGLSTVGSVCCSVALTMAGATHAYGSSIEGLRRNTIEPAELRTGPTRRVNVMSGRLACVA